MQNISFQIPLVRQLGSCIKAGCLFYVVNTSIKSHCNIKQHQSQSYLFVPRSDLFSALEVRLVSSSRPRALSHFEYLPRAGCEHYLSTTAVCGELE